MKYLKKNRRRIVTAAGMLAVAVVSVGCGQHVSLAENTDQAEVWTVKQENNNQAEDMAIKSGGDENESAEAENYETNEEGLPLPIGVETESIVGMITETTLESILETMMESTIRNSIGTSIGNSIGISIGTVIETTLGTAIGNTNEITIETTNETGIETTEELETGTPEITPKETQAVYDGTTEDVFFENSVFVGDSVMMGFRNYILRQGVDGFMGNPEFLVSGSYSLRMALNPISETTIHPIYQGEQRLIWDAMSMLGVDKAFLALGLNDIGMLSVEDTYENYQKVLQAIYEVNPDISIYVISTTNIFNGSEVGNLNNENVRLLNQKMKNYCAKSKEEFIDIADYLIDENGALKEEYCSDNYVHQTSAAYDIWVQVLREFASRHQ